MGLGAGGCDIPVDCGSNECAVPLIANVQRTGIGEPNAKGKSDGCRCAGGRDAACKSRGETREDCDRERCEGCGVTAWQGARMAHLVDRADAVSAAAFSDIHRMVINRQAAEIISLAWFVQRVEISCGRFNDLIDLEVANLVYVWRDRGCLAGNEQFGSGGIDEVVN